MHRAGAEDQRETPFLDGLIGYARSGIVPFHTPGHKQGRGVHDRLKVAMGTAVTFDVSDVVASERYNDSWTEALEAAERLAAEVFGATHTRFVVNGTSGAIHALFLMLRMQGYTHVVMPRESHLSVFAGLVLADLQPIYIENPVLAGWDLRLPPTAAAYCRASEQEKSAWFATYPNYYGIAAPLTEIAQEAHQRGSVLVVDEAHGPHFAFHGKLPPPALACGADLVAQSTHKVLGALTQASMLHVGRYSLLPAVLDRALMLTQSTSPSGLLLASLDAARAQMAADGPGLWNAAIERSEELRLAITRDLGLPVLGADDLPAGYALDPTRLTVRTAARGIHGVEAARLLRIHGVQVEMADPWHVVALITWADDDDTTGALVQALKAVLVEAPTVLPPAPEKIGIPPRPKARMSPRAAALAESEPVPLLQARGRISAEAVCPYPPGVPVICPGEELDEDVVDYLAAVRHRAFEVRGASDPALGRVFVVKE